MKVSVIIPVYNTENTIARCLDSVLHQTFQDLEIIIVDDKGKDNAIKIVSEYASADPRIRVISHKNNRGLMVTRRTGYSAATGDFFMFLDSDDTIPENAITDLLDKITKTNSDIVIGGFSKLDRNDKIIGTFIPRHSDTMSKGIAFERLLANDITHNLAFCIFKSTLFKNDFITLENQTNGEDLILFYQLVNLSNRIAFCQQSIYNYYIYENSSSHVKMNENKLKSLINVQNFKVDFFEDKGIDESLIYKNIIPKVADLYISKCKSHLVNEKLDKRIKQRMSIFSSFKYMKLRSWIKFVFNKLF